MNKTLIDPESTESLIKAVSLEKSGSGSEIIWKRAKSFNYMYHTGNIGKAAEFFIDNPDLEVIGITDENETALGYIARDELLSLVGRKFGRELYSSRNVEGIINRTGSIYYKRNTFSVIEEIEDSLKIYENRYYILVDKKGVFKGVISTGDLKIFLATMMRNDLKSAKKIHNTIVKNEVSLKTDYFEFTAATRMAGEIGGDFHLIKKIDDDRWILSLCDVSGKGIRAALVSIAISSMFGSWDSGTEVQDLIRRLNTFIFELFEGEIFITGVFIVINSVTGSCVFYDMGHSMFYLMKGSKIVKPKSSELNLPLGIKKDIDLSASGFTLEPGNMMISLTDGITEQTGQDGIEYGEKRALALIMKNKEQSSVSIKRLLFDNHRAFREGYSQSDDMSLFILKYGM